MNKMFSNKLILLSSGVAIAVVIGGVFLLKQRSEPQPISSSSSKTGQKELLIESIKNMEYYDPECDTKVKLRAGVFEQKNYQCKGEILPGFSLRIQSDIAFGDLTHDRKDEAAVILSTNYGGSGDFRRLVIMEVQNGNEIQVASQNLGDRVTINTISIQDSRVVLHVLVHASQDPACCPTQKNVVEYELLNNELHSI